MRLLVPATLLSVVSALTGCGGGGGGATNTVILGLAFDRSGTFFLTSGFQNVLTVGASTPLIGDVVQQPMRGFLGFGLAPIPAGRTIEKAVLHFRGTSGQGNPSGELGILTMDWVNTGAGIDNSDYAGNTLTAGLAMLPAFGASFTGFDLDVTGQIQVDVANARPASSFRFQFAVAQSVDGNEDYVALECEIANPAKQPFVTVTLKP